MWRNSALGVRARITERRETVLVAFATLTLVSASAGWVILSRGASASQSSRATPSTFSALPLLDISSFAFASPVGQVGQVGIHHVGGKAETPSVITPITATAPIWASGLTTPPSSASSSSDPLSLDAFYAPPDPLNPSELVIRAMTNPPLDATYPRHEWWRRAEIPAANGHGNARSVEIGRASCR